MERLKRERIQKEEDYVRDHRATEINLFIKKKMKGAEEALRRNFISTVDLYRDGKIENVDTLTSALISHVFPRPLKKDQAVDPERRMANIALRAAHAKRESQLDRLSPNVIALILVLGKLEELAHVKVEKI